jgi:DNA polymerase V
MHLTTVELSNNADCVIARSAEAKALGIPMGKRRQLFRHHDVAVFSSNYTRYGDLSARVMKTRTPFTPSLAVYSIDEVFLDLTGRICRR